MSIKFLQRACPVCQKSIDFEILHTQRFALSDNNPLPDKYDVVACHKCGFVYADTSANQEVYDEYYEQMSKYEMHYSCDESLLYVDRAAWINTSVHNKSDSIIDIGCGNGLLLIELQKLGFTNLSGLDPSEKCVSDLSQKGLNGIRSSVFSIPTGNVFDCAVLSGVLEHIYDVAKLMETMGQLLKRSGLLFVCVPDASRYKIFDTTPFDYFNIEHINHFDETSLSNLGMLHGFSIINFCKTTITLSQTTQPVIFCVYENNGESVDDCLTHSRNCVADYVERTGKNSDINNIIASLLATNEEIIVWGAGNYFSRLMVSSDLDKCNIVFVVDTDAHKQGKKICGKSVYSPDILLNYKLSSTIVIVAAVFYDEIILEINKLNINNKVLILQ